MNNMNNMHANTTKTKGSILNVFLCFCPSFSAIGERYATRVDEARGFEDVKGTWVTSRL